MQDELLIVMQIYFHSNNGKMYAHCAASQASCAYHAAPKDRRPDYGIR